MRPRSSVDGVLLFNSTDREGNWIPMKVEVNSWISLMPGRNGGHAKDAARHGGCSIGGSYKAKVLKFKTSAGSGIVSSVLVQHAYMRRQLDLDPSIPTQNAACNCKFFS